MPVTAVRDEGALRMWVCRLPVHIGPLGSCEFSGYFRKIDIFCGRTESSAPTGQCHQLKTGAFVLCEKTAKQMQLVGAGLCSARQDTPNYRKSSANPYALTRLAIEADAGHSRSRRRSVTDVGLPLAGTHRPGRMHRFYGNLRRIHSCPTGQCVHRPLHPKR